MKTSNIGNSLHFISLQYPISPNPTPFCEISTDFALFPISIDFAPTNNRLAYFFFAMSVFPYSKSCSDTQKMLRPRVRHQVPTQVPFFSRLSKYSESVAFVRNSFPVWITFQFEKRQTRIQSEVNTTFIITPQSRSLRLNHQRYLSSKDREQAQIRTRYQTVHTKVSLILHSFV